ncbi:hypothetical protein FXN61_44435 [Lentzea sp. PSKA42]|uniref:Uncharacterized protein n=1 Tax=Lentzea indica TaxID=2604800 RepID=A0ABX1FY16_9PSEU|nr:hypothetical protein [Lentzea indica]NKE63397.1 hypothetical protein [Lentzea indica]
MPSAVAPDAVGERLRHAVDTALSEAAAIVERAGAIEDHVWTSARQASPSTATCWPRPANA